MAHARTRLLFGSAALVDASAAAALPVAALKPEWMRLIGLDPVHGSDRLFAHLTAMAIALFGLACGLVARDPVGERPLVRLVIVGKLAAVALVWGHWLAGRIGWPLPLLIATALVYAALFWVWLRTHRASAAA